MVVLGGFAVGPLQGDRLILVQAWRNRKGCFEAVGRPLSGIELSRFAADLGEIFKRALNDADVDTSAGIALQVAIEIGPAQRVRFVIVKDHVRRMCLARRMPLVFTRPVLIPRSAAAPRRSGQKGCNRVNLIYQCRMKVNKKASI